MAICLDAFSAPPVRERLGGLGAEILIQPSANNHPWNEWQQKDWLRSSYAAVVENGEFPLAVNPMLVGGLWDLVSRGGSRALSPLRAMRPGRKPPDREEILLYRTQEG